MQYYEIQYKRLGGEEDYGSVADANTEQEEWGSITVAFTSEEDYGLTNEPILSPDAEYVSNFGSTTAFLIQPVLNGYDYNVRVRAVNSLGVRSPFANATLASVCRGLTRQIRTWTSLRSGAIRPTTLHRPHALV